MTCLSGRVNGTQKTLSNSLFVLRSNWLAGCVAGTAITHLCTARQGDYYFLTTPWIIALPSIPCSTRASSVRVVGERLFITRRTDTMPGVSPVSSAFMTIISVPHITETFLKPLGSLVIYQYPIVRFFDR